jgi:hypothetical protein
MPIVVGWWLAFRASLGLCRVMIFFFIAGLLLHLECVPLGAYRIPPGAGLLIPSLKTYYVIGANGRLLLIY